jgi:cysteinyl-tRNA synthetase
MKLYNTLTKKIDDFIPNEEVIVRIYTCGPTVYDYVHIGNLRTYIFEDILEKSLIYLGYEVKRVMNITDVGHMVSDGDTGEDKMVVGAKREGKTVEEIAEFYTEAFFKDLEKLNIKRPEVIEKASSHIEEYIKIISKLIETGYAYVSNGNVYFDVTKYQDYYKLSGMNEEDLIVGAREEITEDKSKRNPFDFGLWFTNSKFKDQLLTWDSPWGKGYPGWHIECSGIALKFLGEKLDIHCGGIDAIFPHHTNEIAQSEAYLGHKWCNYWLHGEHLNDQTGKMSKSKGKFLTLSLLEKKGYDPIVYRFYVLGSHYRKQLVFSYESLDIATNAYNKLRERILNLSNINGELDLEKVNIYKTKFEETLKDDLNISNSLTVLYDLLKDKKLNDKTKLYLIEDFDKVLSLNLIKEEEIIEDELKVYIESKIEERNKAKENKDYVLADKIRDELKAKGIILIDEKDKTTYRKE